MKKLFSYLAMCMFLVGGMALTACSSDDDGNGGNNGDIVTPAHAADAMRLTITDQSSAYSSIEFTESGFYLITPNAAAPAKGISLLRAATPTRASGTNYIYGKYTKSGDTYTLEGFGTVKVVVKNGVVTSLQVQPNGQQPVTLTARLNEKKTASELTLKICRTWKVTKIDIKSDNENFIGNPEDYAKKFKEDSPYEVTVTMSGTYMVKYLSNKLGISSWTWRDESKGIFSYDWSFGTNPQDAGTCSVKFEGSTLVVTEDMSETIQSATGGSKTYTNIITTYMTEVK